MIYIDMIQKLILTSVILSGVHMSSLLSSDLVKPSKMANIRLVHVASFIVASSSYDPPFSTPCHAHSNWFNTILYPTIPIPFYTLYLRCRSIKAGADPEGVRWVRMNPRFADPLI